MIIRLAVESDKKEYLRMVEKLSCFNRENHAKECIVDDYKIVLRAIKEKAEDRFESNDENVQIFVWENDSQIVGYAVGEIYHENMINDNGTGDIGLFDELYLDEVELIKKPKYMNGNIFMHKFRL